VIPYCPDIGDFIFLNFSPQAGNEQSGRRPALVLSPAIYNRKTRLCLVCPITNQKKNYTFEVELPSGLQATGVILADQIRNLSWNDRNSVHIGHCPETVLAEVRAMIKALVQL
jgi:mRNA interferase MazF